MAKANNMTINNTSETDSTEVEPEMDSAPKATLYFSHSEAVLPFLTLLGLNKDDYALTHDNYEEAKERYLLKRSKCGFLKHICMNFHL